MALIVCALTAHGPQCSEHYGVAIINSVTGLPLPLPRGLLTDVEEADDFIEWAGSRQLRASTTSELTDLVDEFRERENASVVEGRTVGT